ncbi:MAG: DinB family protein [Gemmatimonadales bacterium]
MPRDDRILLLLDVIEQVFGRRGWHGTTLTGALRGVTPRAALWRPVPDRHNIWEYTLHVAYWKYIVRRRLTGDRSIRFPRPGSNWPPVPPRPDLAAWRLDVGLLKEQHRLLRQVVARFPASRLDRRAPESKWTYAEHIYGIAAHDAYHTGQIQLVKRLAG